MCFCVEIQERVHTVNALGIDPTVDYVFRKIFGDPKNSVALIHLLNSVLELVSPIVEVTILNPFVEKDYDDDKMVVLDIKARETDGRWLNIEMQTTITTGLRNRLVYYASCLYSNQLQESESFTQLRPVISICFLSSVMFKQANSEHLRFSLCDLRHGLELTDHFQIHIVELPKYTDDKTTVRTAPGLSQWAFFLKSAQHLSVEELRSFFEEAAFQPAIGVLEMVARIPEQRHRHDSQLKAIRDYESGIEEAKLCAKQEGREEGREEGEQIGEQVGRIQLLQQLLREPVTETALLRQQALTELIHTVQRLQARLTERGLPE